MSKEFKVSEEIQDIWIEYAACIGCRDKCINSVFKAKRAINYGKGAEKARCKFFRMVRDLYPELRDVAINYSHDDGLIRITDDE